MVNRNIASFLVHYSVLFTLKLFCWSMMPVLRTLILISLETTILLGMLRIIYIFLAIAVRLLDKIYILNARQNVQYILIYVAERGLYSYAISFALARFSFGFCSPSRFLLCFLLVSFSLIVLMSKIELPASLTFTLAGWLLFFLLYTVNRRKYPLSTRCLYAEN